MAWTVGGSNSGGGEIFRTCPDQSWGPPCLLYSGYRVCFPGVKRPESGVNYPPLSTYEVKERVDLNLYTHSGPSWTVERRIFNFFKRSCAFFVQSCLSLQVKVKSSVWVVRVQSENLVLCCLPHSITKAVRYLTRRIDRSIVEATVPLICLLSHIRCVIQHSVRLYRTFFKWNLQSFDWAVK